MGGRPAGAPHGDVPRMEAEACAPPPRTHESFLRKETPAATNPDRVQFQSKDVRTVLHAPP